MRVPLTLTLTLLALLWGLSLVLRISGWGGDFVVWGLALASSTLPYFMIAACALALCLCFFWAWRWVLCLCVFVGVETAIPLSQTYWGQSPDENGRPFSILSYNVQGVFDLTNEAAEGVDLIFIAEMPAYDLANGFDLVALPGFERHIVPYRSGSERVMALYTRGNPTIEIIHPPHPKAHAIFQATYESQGRKWRVLATHAQVPLRAHLTAGRNAALTTLRDLVQGQPNLSTLVVGDLNTSPHEGVAWRLPGRLVGNPFVPTWVGFGGWHRARIDHIRLHQGDTNLIVTGRQVHVRTSSDHRAISAQFALN